MVHRDPEREVEVAAARDQALGAARGVDLEDRAVVVDVHVVDDPDVAVRSHDQPDGVDQTAAARDGRLAPGERVDPDDPAVVHAGLRRGVVAELARVGHEQVAVLLQCEVVGPLEERPLRTVARDLDERAVGGIGPQDHRAVHVRVGRVHHVGIAGRSMG
jgi:hypothetical protein